MDTEIREGPVAYELVGLSLRHDPARAFGEEILGLLGRVWPIVRASGARHDGVNRVVYGEGCTVFAGLIAEMPDAEARGLERRAVRLTRHAYWKHVGPYRLLGEVGERARRELAARGVRLGWPMVEVYGHWDPDESKLETETLVAVLE